MAESLGSGFDRIRAALMSPTNFDTHFSSASPPGQPSDLSELSDTDNFDSTSSGSAELPGSDIPEPYLANNEPPLPPSLHRHYERSDESDRGTERGIELDTTPPYPPTTRTENTNMESPLRRLAPISFVGNNFSISEDTDNGNSGDLIQDYDFAADDYQSPATDSEDEGVDPEDTRKFYLGKETFSDIRTWPAPGRFGLGMDDLYHRMDYPAVTGIGDRESACFARPHPNSHDLLDFEQLVEVDAHFGAPMQGSTQEQNLSIEQFIKLWYTRASTAPFKGQMQFHLPRPSSEVVNIANWKRLEVITRPQNDRRDFHDIQGIPWREMLRVNRADARALRDAWYTSYHNLEYSPPRIQRQLPTEDFYFREKAMHTQWRATIEHFQLRNLVAVTSHNTVQFAHESKLLSWVPAYNHLTCLMDLSRPLPDTGFQGPVKISTMAAKYGVTVAGGFSGEYCLHVAGMEDNNVQGFVTRDFNGITNHLEIIQHRSSRSPVAVFASNDRHLRILDCETNIFVGDHCLPRAVNCTATSADGRLRVVIGDSPDAWVLEAETGRPIQPLRGHKDFGFACAWSPDMLHIATSNQDKTVNIWDVRTWRILQTIDSDVAGYRSLHFSPVGGGPRTLLMCEPADRIAIVNAQTFQSRQLHDFFGEIGGAGYSPDGGSIWVANSDEVFGGFMEFDRRQFGHRIGLSYPSRKKNVKAERSPEWYSDLPNEWRSAAALEEDQRCVLSPTERRLRFMRALSDEAHDNLLL